MNDEKGIVSRAPLARAAALISEANQAFLPRKDYPAALANFSEAAYIAERADVPEADARQRLSLLAQAHIGQHIVFARHPDPMYQSLARAEDHLDRALVLAQESGERETILIVRFQHALFLGEYKQDWPTSATAWEALLVDRPELGNGLGLGYLAAALSHIAPVNYERIAALLKLAIATATDYSAYDTLAVLHRARAHLLKNKIANYGTSEAGQDLTTATIFEQSTSV